MKRLVLAAPFLATMTCLAGEIETVDSSPVAEGGDYIRRITIDEHHWSYIHVFTNASAAQTFKSTVGWPLEVRYLVVGGGGRGGDAGSNKAGGGGGGGGGVAEVDNVMFAAGASWTVRVGKGAVEQSTQAEGSSISNDVDAVCFVPGGGSGGHVSSETDYVAPIVGAAGGGAAVGSDYAGATGSFASYVLGMTPPANGYAGGRSKSFAAGGGGGAGEAGGNGTSPASYTYSGGKGGEGLVSDITGEDFVYGSGGGGGSVNGGTNKGPRGLGGTNAGNGGGRDPDTGKTLAPTAPVPNSGAGGGGGSATQYTTATTGAAGIVVIRYECNDYPCTGGDQVMVVPKSGGKTTYIHIFTNAQEVGTFFNRSGRDLKVRYLVVGGGGAGGTGSGNFPGGGGGGGGVAEADKVVLATGAGWTVRVGAGSTEELTQAGGSSISNGVSEVCAVPGGGSGGRLESDGQTYSAACVGAAGGGGATSANTSSAYHDGAGGTFASYVLGMTPPTGGYPGGSSYSFFAGGGGGAGAKGDSPKDRLPSNHGGDGGEGLASDITGEMLVYGSGGGGGAVNGSSNFGPGGDGGTRAGNGGGVLIVEDVKGSATAATEPVPNSGAGGGGGGGGSSHKTPTMGADGIVVIRYDYRPVDPGMMLIFR